MNEEESIDSFDSFTFRVFTNQTRTPRISDTIEFLHEYITVPYVSKEDKVIDAIAQLKKELSGTPTPSSSNQLVATQRLQEIFSKYKHQDDDANSNSQTSCQSQNNSRLKAMPTKQHSHMQTDPPSKYFDRSTTQPVPRVKCQKPS